MVRKLMENCRNQDELQLIQDVRALKSYEKPEETLSISGVAYTWGFFQGCYEITIELDLVWTTLMFVYISPAD